MLIHCSAFVSALLAARNLHPFCLAKKPLLILKIIFTLQMLFPWARLLWPHQTALGVSSLGPRCALDVSLSCLTQYSNHVLPVTVPLWLWEIIVPHSIYIKGPRTLPGTWQSINICSVDTKKERTKGGNMEEEISQFLFCVTLLKSQALMVYIFFY